MLQIQLFERTYRNISQWSLTDIPSYGYRLEMELQLYQLKGIISAQDAAKGLTPGNRIYWASVAIFFSLIMRILPSTDITSEVSGKKGWNYCLL